MAKIVSIDEVKGKRAQRELAQLIAEGRAKPIRPNLDLRKVDKVAFVTHVFAWPDRAKTHLHIIVHDVSDGVVRSAGVLRVTAAQWKQLKREVDSILRHHRSFLRRGKNKKSRR